MGGLVDQLIGTDCAFRCRCRFAKRNLAISFSNAKHDAVCRGDEAMVRLLLAHGADAGAPGDANETPLHDAVACGAATLVRLLRRAGADAGARNGRGLTARYFFFHGNNFSAIFKFFSSSDKSRLLCSIRIDSTWN